LQQELQNRKSVIASFTIHMQILIFFISFANHENSKKHKENVATLKATMQEEENEYQMDEEVEEEEEEVAGQVEGQEVNDAEAAGYTLLQEEDDDDLEKLDEEEGTNLNHQVYCD